MVSMTTPCHAKKNDLVFNIPIGDTSIPLIPSFAPCETNDATRAKQENQCFCIRVVAEALKPLKSHACLTGAQRKLRIPILFCLLLVAEALKPVQFLKFLNGGQITARKPIVFVYVLKQRR